MAKVTNKEKQEKKGKVVKCDRYSDGDYDGQHGTLYAFSVEFDNGDKGTYKAKDVNNPKFKVGEIADYELEKVTLDNGNSFFNIRSVSNKDFKKNGYKKMTIEEQQSIFKQVAMTESITAERYLIKAGIEYSSDFFTVLRKKWINALNNKGINGTTVDQQLGINASSAFKITIGMLINSCLKGNNASYLLDEFDNSFNSIFNYINPSK